MDCGFFNDNPLPESSWLVIYTYTKWIEIVINLQKLSLIEIDLKLSYAKKGYFYRIN